MVIQRARRYAKHLINGREAETRARRHLERKGLTFIEANYRCQLGEIDLIMEEGSTLVFVEVRYRKDMRFGGALESIDARKQKRLRAVAEHYLQRRRDARNAPCRFDAVLVTGSRERAAGEQRIEWIPDAF